MRLLETLPTLSRYNRWMNERLYEAASGLDDAARKSDRGAFFGSIHGTFNHLLLADRLWLGRFTGVPYAVAGLDQELYADFAALRTARAETDDAIDAWLAGLSDEALAAPFSFHSVSADRAMRLPMWLCVLQFFNHQTHHRGQLTTLLTQAGVTVGLTDLLWLPGMEG